MRWRAFGPTPIIPRPVGPDCLLLHHIAPDFQRHAQSGEDRRWSGQVSVGLHGKITVDEARKQAKEIMGQVAKGENPAESISQHRKPPLDLSERNASQVWRFEMRRRQDVQDMIGGAFTDAPAHRPTHHPVCKGRV